MTRTNLTYKLLIGALVLILTACASSGRKITQQNIDKIVPGKTTKQEMYQLFGSPTSHTYTSEGTLTMLWHYMYVGPYGTGMKQQILSVFFDKNEVVDKFNMTDSRPD